MANNEEAPLSTMVGSGTNFTIAGKKYTVKPLSLLDIDKFVQSNISIGPQIFNVSDKEAKKILDEWLKKQVSDANGSPFSLEKAMAEGWDLTDLRHCVEKMIDISG